MNFKGVCDVNSLSIKFVFVVKTFKCVLTLFSYVLHRCKHTLWLFTDVLDVNTHFDNNVLAETLWLFRCV